MDKLLKLPIGLDVDGRRIKEVPLARTGAQAEQVYTAPPSSNGLYTWFGEVLSVSIRAIGDETVAAPFLKSVEDGKNHIPSIVRRIPLNDVGTLILQIQTWAWQDVIEAQSIVCKFCADNLTADIDLKKIPVPCDMDYLDTEIIVKLPCTYTIEHGDTPILSDYNGQRYNTIVFSIPTLEDAIRHEKLSTDQVMFWRNIGFDCMLRLEYREGDIKDVVDEGYIAKRGKLLFTKDWDSKTLKDVRKGLMDLPSAKFYYEETCPCNRKKQIPFFTDVNNFFSS